MDILHQDRLCRARPECVRQGHFSETRGEVATAVCKAGRTEVKFGEVSSGNLEQEQEQEVMEVLQDQAVSSDQQGQISKDRNMRNKTGLRSTAVKILAIRIKCSA